MDFRQWLEAAVGPQHYWVSPTGEITSNFTTHIDYILKNPEKFGLSQQTIKQIHDRHGESIGTEGNARAEIMKKAYQDGWIRLRKYNRPDFWTVQTGRIDALFYDRIKKWLSHARWDHKNLPFDEVVITSLNGDKIKMSVSELTARLAA